MSTVRHGMSTFVLEEAETVQSESIDLGQDACRGGGPELPLGLVRVGLTSATLRAAPAASALVEALVLQMLLQRTGTRQGSEAARDPGSPGALGARWGLHADRQASAEEQMLQSAVEAEQVRPVFHDGQTGER